MSDSVLRQLEAIVRRHLWLLPVTMFPCGGCFSCTGIPSYLRPYEVSIRIPTEQQNSLRAYMNPRVVIPAPLCKELCTPERTRTGVPINGCSLPPPVEQSTCERGAQEPGPACETAPPQQLICHYTIREVMSAGRRPSGLQPDRTATDARAATWLAEAAHLESAAVIAFAELHAELTHLAAPTNLTDACLVAMEDERRHARLMTELALAAGQKPAPPVVHPCAPRSAFMLACANAVEGCVRELFGALEALWQSRAAIDPQIRAAMAEIAVDEARHAQLGLEIDAWLHEQLTPAQRRLVRRAQQDAYKTLDRDLATRLSHDPELGLLDGALAREIFRAAILSLSPHVAEESLV